MWQKRQRPSAIFSIFASSDVQYLERWEKHLLPLVQAGTVSIWSARHLLPGTDRETLLRSHLDQADLIVLLLSADFFADDECIALMERALARSQQNKVQLIPLLLRPVVWDETVLHSLTPLPSDKRPVTGWENPDAAFEDCVRGLRRILPHGAKPLPPDKIRIRMLQWLQRTYEETLTQSLQGVTQMELGLADKPDAVQNVVALLLQTSTSPERLLPPGTPILRVYDEATQDLLILGAPGAGKSTLLVELARQLVVRAEADETHPLPVILPLSSWAVKRPPLGHWLVEQVALSYDIPNNIAEKWINEDRILPLLDGLDEMEEAAVPACIAAINTYHRDHLRLSLVVCCRLTAYETAAKTQRLALQNAVVVQPLSYEQVQAYLKQGGKPLAALRRVLSTNHELAMVVTTPLMVHVLILTYQGTSVRQLSTQRERLEQQVWIDYVQRMVERKRNRLHYPSHQIIAWLGSLARQMRDRNQTIFYLEQLQPDWLPGRQRSFYRWSIVLFFLLGTGLLCLLDTGLLCLLDTGPLFWSSTGLLPWRLDFWLPLWLTGGSFFGLFYGLKAKIEPTEAFTWSWKNWGSWLILWLIVGLIAGLIVGTGGGLIAGTSGGLIMGLIMGLVLGPFVAFSGKQLPEHRMLSPNEGIRRSVKNGLLFGLLAGLPIGLLVGLPFGILNGLIVGLHVGLIVGLLFGLLNGLFIGLLGMLVFGLPSGLGAGIQHYTLRFWLWRTRTFPRKAQRFLDDAVACILLRRIGGSYSFIHRLLMDYFIDLPTGPTPTSAAPLFASKDSPPANNPSA